MIGRSACDAGARAARRPLTMGPRPAQSGLVLVANRAGAEAEPRPAEREISLSAG